MSNHWAFQITKDFIECGRDGFMRFSYETEDDAMSALFHANQTTEERFNFRVADDDDIIYFEGVYAGPGDEESMYEPLAWAMYDAGAVRMDIREKGHWKSLFG